MKVVAKPIDMIAWFTKQGIPTPIRFRIEKEDKEFMVIKVDKIMHRNTEKLAGNPMIVYTCQSLIEGIERLYEIKYEISTCKWTLFKI